MNTAPVFLQIGPKAMTREEIAEAFAPLSVSDPLARALLQILAERQIQATVSSTDPRLSEREAGIAAGRITEVLDLSREVLGLLRATKPGTNRVAGRPAH